MEVQSPSPEKERPEPAFMSGTPIPGDPGAVFTHGCFHPAHAEVIRFFEKNLVYAVQIESCLSCPGGCRYCYASAQNPVSAELPPSSIHRILHEVKEAGVRAIDWLGGDPLMRKDWYELAHAAQELGLINNIWTSGIPLADPRVAQQVAEVTSGGFVSVHLDSLEEEVYRVLHTGDPGAKIRSTLTGVKNLFDAGKQSRDIINCITFTRPLAGKDVERTIRYFSDKGIRTCLTQICMAGLGKEHPEWVPSGTQIRHAISVRDRINYPGSDLSMSSMDVNKYYCGGTVCITVKGDVTPCSVIRQGFGNVHHLPFAEIISRHRSELLFLPLRAEGSGDRCSSCKNHPVCWGCRATAFYTTGDLMADDPHCRVRERDTIMKKHIDISIAEVSEAYAGPVGTLWELVMGEEIHIGGTMATRELAVLAGIKKDSRVLDICSALGGPARHLAAEFGCRVTGIDATPAMVDEATRRTATAGLDGRVTFRLGNALDLPFRGSSFDTIWGQDAWCYVTDKARLIREAARVTKTGGTIAFTDWIQLRDVPDLRLDPLLSFMLFPYLETPEGYPRLLEENGWVVTAAEDMSRDFAEQFTMYRSRIQGELRPEIIRQFGESFFSAVEDGIALWENAAHEGIVGRGRWIARKTGT